MKTNPMPEYSDPEDSPEFQAIVDELEEFVKTSGLDKEPMDDPTKLYIPYYFRYHTGDTLRLKTGDSFKSAREQIFAELADTNIPKNVSWIPTDNLIEQCADVSMTVIMTMAYHFGYPLYILHFNLNGHSHEIRLCEAFLIPEKTKG